MQARRASRELALILFSQLDKNTTNYTNNALEDIILKSVRTLTSNATDDLKMAVSALDSIKEQILDFETDHETNLQRPIGTANKSVPMIMTKDFIEKIDALTNVAEKSLVALEIAEMTTLEEKSDVKNYILRIAKEFLANKDVIDAEIQKFSVGWNIDRLVKMDKDILRIAITELLFVKSTPLKVVIDEAVELAKKYSTEDSSSFINGILGKVVDANSIKR